MIFNLPANKQLVKGEIIFMHTLVKDALRLPKSAREGWDDGLDHTDGWLKQTRHSLSDWISPHEHFASRSSWLPPLLLGLALGALAARLLDPARGHGRRSELVQRFGGISRRSVRHTSRQMRGLEAAARGTAAGLLHREVDKSYNDATLSEKVESELFRDPAIPKGAINVNAERGVIVLRGEVPSEQVDLIADRARKISGVVDVDNRLSSADSGQIKIS